MRIYEVTFERRWRESPDGNWYGPIVVTAGILTGAVFEALLVAETKLRARPDWESDCDYRPAQIRLLGEAS